jgi:hypothetical protein
MPILKEHPRDEGRRAPIFQPLIGAGIAGDEGQTASLLASGEDVNAVNENGTTALMRAARAGHTGVMGMLIAAGATLDHRSQPGATALMEAAANGRVAAVDLLLQAGADMRILGRGGRMSALGFASEGGHAEVVAVLETHQRQAQVHAARDEVLAAVAQDGYALRSASAELRADREVVLAAVAQNGDALQHASVELRADPTLQRLASFTKSECEGRLLAHTLLQLRLFGHLQHLPAMLDKQLAVDSLPSLGQAELHQARQAFHAISHRLSAETLQELQELVSGSAPTGTDLEEAAEHVWQASTPHILLSEGDHLATVGAGDYAARMSTVTAGGAAMTAGTHRARFIVKHRAPPSADHTGPSLSRGAYISVGVSEASFDTAAAGFASDTQQGWGWSGRSGILNHAASPVQHRTKTGSLVRVQWQTWTAGDVLELELNCDAGTLIAYKDGVRCGVPGEDPGLKGVPLRWACELFQTGDAIRIEAAELEPSPEPVPSTPELAVDENEKKVGYKAPSALLRNAVAQEIATHLQPTEHPEAEAERHAESTALPPVDENDVLRSVCRLNISKVSVGGSGRAGKTSLLRVIRGEIFRLNEESTRGLAACTVDVREETWSTSGGELAAATYQEKLALEIRKLALEIKKQADIAEPEPEPEWDMPMHPQRRSQSELDFVPEPESQRHPKPARVGLRLINDRKGTVAAEAGQPCRLSVKVDSNSAVTFQWLKNGEPVGGATSEVLILDSASPDDEGDYACLVTVDGAQPVKSATKRVRLVESQPIVVKEISPAKVWVNVGGSVQFGVNAQGGMPDEMLQFRWLHNNTELERPMVSRIGHACFISVHSAEAETAGQYYVEVQCPSQERRGAPPVCCKPTSLIVTGLGIMEEAMRIIAEKGDSLVDDSATKVVHDFAGQRMYYVLHQILLTEALTRYMTAHSLEHDLDHELEDEEDREFGLTRGENLDFWLNSIHSRAPAAPITLVCTKKDLVPEKGVLEARLNALQEFLRGKPYEKQIEQILTVSSKTGEGVAEVRQILQDSSCLLRYGEEVALGWFKFHSIVKEMMRESEAADDPTIGGIRRITLAQACQIASTCSVRAGDVSDMLQRFHDVGLLMWHDTPDTRDLVILDVQWIIDQMTQLLCRRIIRERYNASATMKDAWSDLDRYGRLNIGLLPELWPDLQRIERQHVLHYMVHFGLCCHLQDAGLSESEQMDRSVWLVPTLLPKPAPDAVVWPANQAADKSLRVCFVTAQRHSADWPTGGDRKFLPDTLFFRLVAHLVRAVKHSSDQFRHLYSDRVVICTPTLRYMLSHDAKERCLELTVYGGQGCEAAPATVLSKLEGCLDGIVADFGVNFRFEIHCDHLGERRWYSLNDAQSTAVGQLWLTQAQACDAEPEPEEQDHPGPQAVPNSRTAPRFPRIPMDQRKYDFFINHCQASGQDQCNTLCLKLQKAGNEVWYDMQSQDLTAQGMEEGVSQSRNFLIFLSDGVMSRPFCNAEQRWAEQYGCNLIGVVEKDSRHNPADFGQEKESAPADLKRLLDEVEYLDYERREYKARGMIEEIMRQGAPPAKAAPTQPEPEPEPEPHAEEGVPPAVAAAATTITNAVGCHANVMQWLESVKLQACHAALEVDGYGDDIDCVMEGDDEEVALMITAVSQMEGIKIAMLKKFKRELAKLRGRGEAF